MEASPFYVLLRQEDPFGFIGPEEFEALGVDPEDVPVGTVAALRHPAQIPSRFGGNAYGLGLTEGYERLNQDELNLILSINMKDEKSIREHYRELNEIYKKLGLLIRFSKKGRPYYLIPLHFISSSLTDIKGKIDEIADFIRAYARRHTKGNCDIGILTGHANLIFQELSFIFLEHNFIAIDSINRLMDLKQKLNVFILIDDIYDIITRDRLFGLSDRRLLRKQVTNYAHYLLSKAYQLLTPEGEFFAVSKRYIAKTDRMIRVNFKDEEEEKRFAIFSHVFKTRRRYNFNRRPLYINEFDFHSYLSGIYVEPEIINRLLGGRDISSLGLQDINKLPYIDLKLPERPFNKDQKEMWSDLFKRYFEEESFCSIVPDPLKDEWRKKFELYDYQPEYMLLYSGRRKRLPFTLYNITKEVIEDRLYSSPPDLLPDYRNSFEYVISVLNAVKGIRKRQGNYKNIPKIFMDRLVTPLHHRNRRFSGINAILKLIKKENKIIELMNYFNPDHIEGPNTKLIENLELMGLFGFELDLLKELYFICLGHGSIRRIIAGKINEASLKPIIEKTYLFNVREALNLLRYFRLMSFAEMEASKGDPIEREEVRELFRIYDLMVRAVISKDIDWKNIVYEGADSIEGMRRKVIKRLLMMMNYHQFLDNWQEIKEKGEKELESLADYKPENMENIHNMTRLINIMAQFEYTYIKSDPLYMTAFYRKILRADLHGTARIFRKMDSRNVFLLLWITINAVATDIINFNPLLTDISQDEIEACTKKIDQEASYINIIYLSADDLKNLSDQLNKNRFTIIVGTGFYLKLDPKSRILSIAYMDLDNNIQMLKAFHSSFSKSPNISRISNEGLMELERIFSEIELFYQAHKELEAFFGPKRRLPLRHRRWLHEIVKIRNELRSLFLKIIFQAESFYVNLESLYNNAPSVLNFLFPFFKELQEMDLSWHIYMQLSPLRYILSTTKKLYALIRHKKDEFQDKEFLHKLAKKEFGLMATGTIGLSESQVDELIGLLEKLRTKRPVLFNALIKSFFFQEIGRIPYLREKHKGRFNPADLGQAGAVFIREEGLGRAYYMEKEEENHLIFLINHHSMLHHMIRGEFSFFAIEEILGRKDQELFDAFFIFSFIMLSAIREDLLLEDLADRLFKVKAICDSIIEGTITLKEYMNRLFSKKGVLFFELEAYLKREGTGSSSMGNPTHARLIEAGKMIYALERIFRLRGLRYVEFPELVKLIMNTPINLIYRQKGFSSIGYSTFEKELFEAHRIYKAFQELSEEIRHYILNWLVDDKVRIFGYEKVTNYLSYDNQMKLLLLILIGAEDIVQRYSPVSLNLVDIGQIVEKKYEAINDYLNGIDVDDIWEYKDNPHYLFKEKEGLFLKREEFASVVTVCFKDRIDIQKRVFLMKRIDNIDDLRSYYKQILDMLRNYPFDFDDYREILNKAYEERLKELFEEIIIQAKKQMDSAIDFQELYAMASNIMERVKAAGVSEDVKNRLMDLYELRKDSIKREKIMEVDARLKQINGIRELNEYWNSIKLYLKINRKHTGREFELLVAKKFDLVEKELLAKDVI